MKRLHLLKPNVKEGYLDFGKGQKVTYIDVDSNLDKEALSEDIKNGAQQFKELEEYIKKKPSRFNIVYCSKEEDGLMAVEYLAAIYNKLEKLNPDDYFEEDSLGEQDFTFADFDDMTDPFDSDYEEDWEDSDQWVENPWKIPIITSHQLASDAGDGFLPFSRGDFSYGGRTNNKERIPYWYNVRRDNICVTHSMDMMSVPIGLISEQLKRYQNNRHVFLVVVMDKEIRDSQSEGLKWMKSGFCEILLEYAAGSFNVLGDEAAYKKYYEDVFENWIDRAGFKLEKNFPISKITEKVLDMNNPDKADLLNKVVQYTIKDEDRPRTLKESDFDIIKQFEALGICGSDKHKSIEKMKNELVGMESVKEQITGIVEVLKYNKRRAKLGLPTGSYHNVHMMLGAPGTAKTTVAELLGNIMAEEHLLRGNRFVSVNGAELKGMYVGHSAPKVKALFDEYDIIFIDEAYAMCAGRDGDSDSFSQEAIAQLIVELEKHGMDRLVMFAGYGGENVTEKDNKMKSFMNANPGIRSRINSTIFFDSYTVEEMLQIFHCHGKIGKYVISKKADNLVRDYFRDRVRENDFGNGREARSLLENSMCEAARRLASIPEDKITEKMMREIKAEDVEAAINKMRNGLKTQKGRASKGLGFKVS